MIILTWVPIWKLRSRIHDHPIGECILLVETKGSTNSSEYAYFSFVDFLGVEIFIGKIFEKLIDIVNQIKSDQRITWTLHSKTGWYPW